MATIVILAAGLGSRFGGNKQLAEFGPRKLTLMEYNLMNAVNAGFTRVIFVIRPELEKVFKQQVLPRLPKNLDVELVQQTLAKLPEGYMLSPDRTKPLGTAHALWCCADLLLEGKQSFAVINADDYYGKQAFKLLFIQKDKTPTRHLMVAYQVQNTLSDFGGVNRGLCQLTTDNQLKSIKECENIHRENKKIIGHFAESSQQVELSKESLVSMNCWLFNLDILPLLSKALRNMLKKTQQLKDECYLPDVVMQQILKENKKISVLSSTSPWFGLTYPQDSQNVEIKITADFVKKV
jgi:NDP-sugar pyrophosphorylase family protein